MFMVELVRPGGLYFYFVAATSLKIKPAAPGILKTADLPGLVMDTCPSGRSAVMESNWPCG
jgi:hypothetical protein